MEPEDSFPKPPHTHSSCWCCPSLSLGSQLPSTIWVNKSSGESFHPSFCLISLFSSSQIIQGPASIVFFSYLTVVLGAVDACLGSALLSPGRLVGRFPGGNGSWSLTVMLKEGDEGEANLSELKLLLAKERKERRPTTFCRQACLFFSVFSKAGPGMVTSGDSPYLELLLPTALDLGTAKTQKPCCEHSCFLEALLLLRRNKSTGAKICFPKKCSPAVRNTDINVQQC